MTRDWTERAEAICHACGGACCRDACPPLSTDRIRAILSRGPCAEKFEQNGYRRIRLRDNGLCAMMENGRCTIHEVKPETCRAGPFTFSVTDSTIEIFLKRETICPLVAFIKEDPQTYASEYAKAVTNISDLVAALPEGELRAISAIPEPETDKVGEVCRPPGRLS